MVHLLVTRCKQVRLIKKILPSSNPGISHMTPS